jgi:hypothetical protein
MKKLLLSPLLAKDNTPKKQYKVQIIQNDSSKKGWGTVALVIGSFVFDVIANVTANSDSVKKIAQDVEDYVNSNGLDAEQITQKFGQQLKISIIQKFQAKKRAYRVWESMRFDIKLTQSAYTYLLSMDDKHSCVVFPNDNDRNNLYTPQNHALPANNSYDIQSNKKGRETLYLITSLRPLYFDKFKTNSFYRCASRNVGLRKIAEVQNGSLNDVYRVDLEVQGSNLPSLRTVRTVFPYTAL